MTINSNDAFDGQANESRPCVSGAKRKWMAPVLSSFPAQKSEGKDFILDFMEAIDTSGPS